jgi:hypothetical protein
MFLVHVLIYLAIHSLCFVVTSRVELRVFENRVLRRIFGPKRDEMTGSWRNLHNEEFHILNSSQSIIRTMESRRMRWVEHITRMGRKGMHTAFSWESQ